MQGKTGFGGEIQCGVKYRKFSSQVLKTEKGPPLTFGLGGGCTGCPHGPHGFRLCGGQKKPSPHVPCVDRPPIDCQMGTDGVKCLVPALQQNTSLRLLSLCRMPSAMELWGVALLFFNNIYFNLYNIIYICLYNILLYYIIIYCYYYIIIYLYNLYNIIIMYILIIVMT